MSSPNLSLYRAITSEDVASVQQHVRDPKFSLDMTEITGSLSPMELLQAALNTQNAMLIQTLLRYFLGSDALRKNTPIFDAMVLVLTDHVTKGQVRTESKEAVELDDGTMGERNSITSSNYDNKHNIDPKKETSAERMARCLDHYRQGGFLIVLDSEDRENEGDLIIAAEKITADAVAFMVRHCTGMICVGMSEHRIDSLKLPQMVEKNSESHQTAFTVSVDYAVGSSTGISAADRAATIRALADPTVTTDKFNKPGHMFPLKAKEGGVLARPGHTEASVDLSRLAGFEPAGAICEICNEDGTMSRAPTLERFGAKFNIPVLYITDIIAFRQALGHKGTYSDWAK